MKRALTLALLLIARTTSAQPEPVPVPAPVSVPVSVPAPASVPVSVSAPVSVPVSAALSLDTRPRFTEGTAGPATSAGSTGLSVRPGLEIIADYDLHVARTDAGYTWNHDFELQRGHASFDASYGPVSARMVVEAVRSASEGALLGVSGDSLVFRVREASIGLKPWTWLDLEGGVIPTLTIPELDGTFALRAVAATPLESTGLDAPADLGASARVIFPRGYGFAAVAATNGEGYTGRELNRGKNVEGAIELHPFAADKTARPFAVFASGSVGSSGTGSARSDRVTGALLWQGLRIRAGAAFTYALGTAENGDQRGYLVDGFARTEPIDRLILGVRAFWWARDLDVKGDGVGAFTAAAGWRVVTPFEGFVSLTRSFPESTAASSLPDVDAWDVRLIGHVVF
jgi:hypothetical protein